MKLRIKFAKYGALKFIGHLDVMRFFQKAIRRANVDIAYTGGFSPHQIMSFAAPLGVGLESEGEYMDIEVNSITTSQEMLNALNQQMVDGIRVLEVKLLPDNAGNAMASVAAASYSIRFRPGYEPSFNYAEALTSFYAQPEITVTKKTKRSEATFDMKPYIYECKMDQDGTSIYLTVDASSSGNIKPSLVINALYQQNNAELDEIALLITRKETYMNISEDENTRNLVPLSYIGKDF